MKGKKKRRWLTEALVGVIGLSCALILGGLFYAVMVYQLAGEPHAQAQRPLILKRQTPLPLEEGADMRSLMPGALLALDEGILIDEQAQDVHTGGQMCRVITRIYQLEDGTRAQVISASPEAYLERISEEEWQPQLITGFVIDSLDAVYARRGDQSLLAAREGGCVYMIEAQADEQRIYGLGASAVLEGETP